MTSSGDRSPLASASDDDASTVAETTPLLLASPNSSGASSHTLGEPRESPEAQILLPSDGGENGASAVDDKAPAIGRVRGACIIFSVWVLIFLQGKE